MADAGSARRAVLVWEEVSPTPDEGYDRFSEEVVRALCSQRPVVSYTTPSQPGRSPAQLMVTRQLRMLALAARIRALPAPRVIVYASRNPVTVPGVFRALLLRVVGGGRVVMFVLVPNRASGIAMRLLRLLRPDHLLLGSEADRAVALRSGFRATVIDSGVDLERFRPPRPGEPSALRRRYGLPVRSRIVLHVGHLRGSRGLEAVLPLTRRRGVTVVVVASHHRWPDSDRVRARLAEHGVVVLDGYQPRIEELYRLADCYVFPGAGDGAVALPLSILEAAASGLPIVAVPYEAIADRRGQIPRLLVVDGPSELPAAVERVLRESDRPAAVPRALTWAGVAEALGAVIDDVAGAGSPARPARLPWTHLIARRRLRRSLLAVTRLLGNTEPPARAMAPLEVELTAAAAVPAPPASDRMLVLGDEPQASTVARWAELLGLKVDRGAEWLAAAVEERWPLAVAMVGGTCWPEAGPLLRALLGRGGTLYLEGVASASSSELEAAEQALGEKLPRTDATASVREFFLTPDGGCLWGAYAGMRVGGLDSRQAPLMAAGGWAPRLLARFPHGHRPLVAEREHRGGRIVASALAPAPPGAMASALAPPTAPAAVAPLALLRALYGPAAWHPPAVLANVTLDDPALLERRPGLPYRRIAALAAETGFHLTVATIPAELTAADPAVVHLLAAQPGRLSACYHGCHHTGYEFGLRRDGALDEALLERQRAALRRAAELGRRFTRRHGLAPDRVMVFPHGIGPARLLPELWRLGFVASCNYANRPPLAAAEPEVADLGARPADLAWHGFPLLWRRPLEEHDWALDILLGRPVLMFGHANLVAGGLDLLADRAAEVARAASGPLAWRRLEEIARHAYLQRLRPDGGWSILMTSVEACIHNPDSVLRRCRVHRPHLPAGSWLEVEGRRLPDGAEVEIPARATSWVRVAPTPSGLLPVPARDCSLFDVEPTGDAAAELVTA